MERVRRGGSKSYAYATAASAGLARRTNTLSKEVTSFDLRDLMDCFALASFTRTYIPSFDADCLIAEPFEKMPGRVTLAPGAGRKSRAARALVSVIDTLWPKVSTVVYSGGRAASSIGGERSTLLPAD
jgi:hypothetical protein